MIISMIQFEIEVVLFCVIYSIIVFFSFLYLILDNEYTN